MTSGGPGGLAGLDDRALLARHVDGDPDAFGVLVARHADRMWAVALRTTGRPEDAADAVQDAVVRAFRAADGFEGRSAVTTWLHRIVVNASLDLLRRQRSRPSVGVDDDTLEAMAHHHDAVAVPPDPGVARERQLDVVEALRSLPEEQRTAVVLVDLEGYSVAEAAEMLGCAVGTVKSRCSRGRHRLAPLLAAYRPGGADPPAGNRTAPPSVEVPDDDRTGGEHDGARP